MRIVVLQDCENKPEMLVLKIYELGFDSDKKGDYLYFYTEDNCTGRLYFDFSTVRHTVRHIVECLLEKGYYDLTEFGVCEFWS